MRARLISLFLVLGLVGAMSLPVTAHAAESDKLACLFYQTFRERDPGDCIL